MAEPAWFEVRAVVRTTPDLLERAHAALEDSGLAELETFDVTPLDDDLRRWDGSSPRPGIETFDALRRGLHVYEQ